MLILTQYQFLVCVWVRYSCVGAPSKLYSQGPATLIYKLAMVSITNGNYSRFWTLDIWTEMQIVRIKNWLDPNSTTCGCKWPAGVKQQPPMHQFRMRPFKPFWGWTKNTSSCLAQGFCSPFSAPKFSPPTYSPSPTYFPPSYLPSPSYLPHLISCSLHL